MPIKEAAFYVYEMWCLQCLNRGGTRAHDVPLVYLFSRLNIDEDNRFTLSYETSRNGFRNNKDSNGENVPEELKQDSTCVDSLPVST